MNACVPALIIGVALLVVGCPRTRETGLKEKPAHGTAFVIAAGMAGAAGPAEMAERVRVTHEIVAVRLEAIGTDYFMEAEGEARLVIIVPGQTDEELESIRHALSHFGLIEFRRVHPTIVPGIRDSEDIVPGYEELVLESERQGEVVEERLWVKRVPDMDGSAIKRADTFKNPQGRIQVSVELTDEGGELFRQLTRAMAEGALQGGPRERLAIVIDRVVITAPTVQGEISGGRLEISGSFTHREALELCNLLNNPLDFPIRIVEERSY